MIAIQGLITLFAFIWLEFSIIEKTCMGKKKNRLAPKANNKNNTISGGEKKNGLVEIQLATIKHAIYSFKK